jgi:hypothetical protein
MEEGEQHLQVSMYHESYLTDDEKSDTMYRYRVKTQKTKSRCRLKLIPKGQDELFWCLAFMLHHTHKSWMDLVKQSLESSTIFWVIQKFQVHIDVQFKIWQGVVTMRKVWGHCNKWKVVITHNYQTWQVKLEQIRPSEQGTQVHTFMHCCKQIMVPCIPFKKLL